MRPANVPLRFARRAFSACGRVAPQETPTSRPSALLRLSHLAVVGLLIAFSECWALGLQVVPSVGRSGGHFIVSGGGIASLGPCGFEVGECQTDGTVTIDGYVLGTFSYGIGVCESGFTIDLANVPGQPTGSECVSCLLSTGVHTVTFSGYAFCPPNQETDLGSVCATFEIVSDPGGALGDPWSLDSVPIANPPPGPGQKITFSPDVQDVPPCDSLVLIQSCRMRGRQTGPPESWIDLSFAQIGVPDGDDLALMEAVLTPPPRVSIDVGSSEEVPFATSIALGHQTGRKGSGITRSATFMDRPFWNDEPFIAPGITRVQFEFEVNAFCVSGAGQGQWLGKSFWLWDRTVGSPYAEYSISEHLPHDRGHPTSDFMRAITLWQQVRKYTLPGLPEPPTEGGGPCN